MDARPELTRDTWVAIHSGFTLAILGIITMSGLCPNFIRAKDLRKPLDFIYLNLFVFDALVLLAVAVGELGRFSIGLPYLPKVACQIEGAFVGIGGLGVLACLAQIGWERYNIVIKNVEYPLRVYQLAMVGTWVYVTTLSIAMGSIDGCVQNPGTSTCIGNWSSRDPRQMAIILISGGLLLALSSTAMLVSYGGIGKKISGLRKEVLEYTFELDSRMDAEIAQMLQSFA
ncbi:hypothetical protein M427DRAFT_35407 [Gonapodya prolifera JEL478]|uniref:G-protein coupled receptors family 1 profile domain-containing protein n=1 Tax=Gonapodya prolifera (strain JEL478) TaxID=1344416 RepID=A0A139A627_GONPJ|nr:hypothetical protein M427DRAFT_35407 [Gonapodya prolifera JEL478]|eukprot:KXS11833.1 hypothetical protein M427DRAFT_35407 [Gonapodya prolifera JEL478]